ncbi:MAG: hypothetical protein IT369_06645 [Candidatus Latescibacteria bacterium]|nr:hypothetical protein [Candidatus Latescibacterota bacterium]
MNLFGRSKKNDNEQDQMLEAIVDLNLRRVNIVLVDGKGEEEDLGRSQFLRSEDKVYREGGSFFLTTPDKLKSQSSDDDTVTRGEGENAPKPVFYNNRQAVLRFLRSGMPYEVPCTIVQRVRLRSDQIEKLDFAGIKNAFRIVPTGMPQNHNKRQFIQFNYVAEDKKAVVHQVTMDLFVQKTSMVVPPDTPLVDRITEVTLIPYSSGEDLPFEVDQTLREFYTTMRALPPNDRVVNLAKIERTTDRGMSADRQYNHGRVAVLSVDNEELLSRVRCIYLKKSAKSDRDRKNPFNLDANDVVVLSYMLDGMERSFACKVMERRTGNEQLRPTSVITQDPGFHLPVMNFRGNGIMVASDMEFIRYVTGENLEEFDFHHLSTYQENILRDLKSIVLYCAIYPVVRRETYEVHFRKQELQLMDRFIPELPYKIQMLGRIVRTERIKGHLTHSIQFDYDTQMFQMKKDDLQLWRVVPRFRGNRYFNEILVKLSAFEAYLRKKHEEQQGN